VVEDHISVWIRFGKRFLQLLHHPFGRGMSGNVAAHNRPPAVLDDQEGVKQFERQCGYSEKVKRNDRLAMIGKKCLPALTVLAGPGPQTSQISCDGAFRDLEAEL
jgi:hypothetical protein